MLVGFALLEVVLGGFHLFKSLVFTMCHIYRRHRITIDDHIEIQLDN